MFNIRREFSTRNCPTWKNVIATTTTKRVPTIIFLERVCQWLQKPPFPWYFIDYDYFSFVVDMRLILNYKNYIWENYIFWIFVWLSQENAFICDRTRYKWMVFAWNAIWEYNSSPHSLIWLIIYSCPNRDETRIAKNQPATLDSGWN